MENYISDTQDISLLEPKIPVDYPFLASLDLDADVVTRLSRYLKSVEKGSDLILTTPLCKRYSPDDLLKAWDKVFEANSHKLNPALLELEMSNRSRFSPRSIALPWLDRIPGVSSYFEEDKCLIQPKFLYPSRLDKGYKRLKPISLDNAIDYLKRTTNSGLPYFKEKRKVIPFIKRKYEELLRAEYPCILFTRTQENNKTRNVWGYPIALTIFETMYYRPLLDYQRKLNWRAALIGPEEVDKQITRLIKDRQPDEILLSLDLDKYDASVKKRLQGASFNYISNLFQDKYSEDIKYLQTQFNSIGLLTPSGILKGEHGVPSGSTFTNEVDSIVQYLIAKSSGTVVDEKIQIQGDDGAYAIRRDDLDDLLSSFSDAGTVPNKIKSKTAEDYVIYLQNLYHPDYQHKGLIRGVYPTYRALCRLVYQERWSEFEDEGLSGVDYYSIRAFSILENCRYHPLFKEFVMFIKDMDKYSLRVSSGALSKYTRMVDEGSGAGSFLNNQRGDNIKGLYSFESFKLVVNSMS